MKLVVHVGMHKTATTALQAALFENANVLRPFGVYIPMTDTGLFQRAHHNTGHQLRDHPRFDPRGGTWEQLVDELRAARPPFAFFSNENLTDSLRYPNQIAKIRRYADDAGAELVLLATVREQIGAINSWYQQMAKMLAVVDDFPTFVSKELDSWRWDYNRLFDHVLGLEDLPVVIVPFSRVAKVGPVQAALEPFVEMDFLSVMTSNRKADNSSVGPKSVAVGRFLSRYLRQMDPDFTHWRPEYAELARKLVVASERAGWNEEGVWGWDEELRDMAVAHFAESNNRFAQRVWGTDWPDPPGKLKPKNTVELDELSDDEAYEVLRLLQSTAASGPRERALGMAAREGSATPLKQAARRVIPHRVRNAIPVQHRRTLMRALRLE